MILGKKQETNSKPFARKVDMEVMIWFRNLKAVKNKRSFLVCNSVAIT